MIVWAGYRDALVPEFADACDAAIGPLPDVWPVTSGLRTMAAQAALYAQGRTMPGPIVTHAKPGDSAHNWGLAIDVALQTPTGLSWDYARPEWQSLWAAVRAAPILHSGNDFPPILDPVTGETVDERDPPHIERLNWRQHEPPPDDAQ